MYTYSLIFTFIVSSVQVIHKISSKQSITYIAISQKFWECHNALQWNTTICTYKEASLSSPFPANDLRRNKHAIFLLFASSMAETYDWHNSDPKKIYRVPDNLKPPKSMPRLHTSATRQQCIHVLLIYI